MKKMAAVLALLAGTLGLTACDNGGYVQHHTVVHHHVVHHVVVHHFSTPRTSTRRRR